jgi:hypothetical protein
MRDDMSNPYQNTATVRLIADRIRDLAHKKTQAEIASEADFPNANMMTSEERAEQGSVGSRALAGEGA